MEEEIGSSSDDQEEEEWSYPCLPPNKSNSLTNTLFDSPPCLTKEDECDIYIVEFVHDATENYYERGKYGLAVAATTVERSWNLKLWTGHHSTMQSWGAQHLQN
jgi:hypothetical protein